MRSILALFVFTCLTASCDSSPPAHTTRSPSGVPESAPRHVGPDTLAVGILKVDSGGDDCGLVREQRYPDSMALVRDYLRSDTAADYGDTDRFLCPDYAVGSDESSVVSYLRFEPLAINTDTSRFLVHSERDGYMRWDTTGKTKNFVSAHAVLVDTFVAIRTTYGWRIAAPLPRVDETSANAVTGYSSIDSASRDSLRRLAAKARPGV